jgi:hypothetical protein
VYGYIEKVPQVSWVLTVPLNCWQFEYPFLINGKPSSIFGSNITDVLQATLPARSVALMITNPGAKYDAQGAV